jgi:ATP-dependent DNA helicase PIF1
VILLRNLYPKEGLCNGTRMVVTRISRRCIEARILGGSFNGQVRLIPRIKLTSTEGELPYVVTRTQFPLRLCFTKTVNKSQGQSFNYVGVDLRVPPFTHRQLYVALSRVTNMANLSLLLPQDKALTTENIIYPEVLLR